MRVALVHDWLTGMRGGERCLEVFCELFPDADLFTLLHIPGRVAPQIERHRIVASFLQNMPAAHTGYRHYLPLMPAAVARFDLRGYDLVLSSSHCVAKGAHPGRGALHICYCFTPMRYVWDRYDDYVGPGVGLATRMLMPAVAPALRAWDRAASRRVHHFVAISEHVRDRIRRCYGRDAIVIYPPVDVQRFEVADGDGEDYYLVVSAFVPPKHVDLAILASNTLRRRLIVVGMGPEEQRLRAMAGPTVEFLGWRDDAEVAQLYRRCRAVLFPGCEDFGIVPLEAMAAGRPCSRSGRVGPWKRSCRPGRTDPHGPPVRRAESAGNDGRHRAVRTRGASLRAQGLAGSCRALRPHALPGGHAWLRGSAPGGRTSC